VDGGEYELVKSLGPAHMGKGHAVQFLDEQGKMHGGQVTGWGKQGASVHVQNTGEGDITHQVPYHQIRSITPPTAAGSDDLAKSAAIDTKKTGPDVQVGDEVLLRGDRVARVQCVGVDVVHVVRDDGVYHRARPRDVAQVLKRAPRPRADQVAAPPATRATPEETPLTPAMFAANDLVAWRSGSLHGTALIERVLPTELRVITLPGGSLVPHQHIRLTVDKLRPLSVALLSTAAAGDMIRVLVQDGLEDGRVEKVATPDGVYATQAGQLAFLPSAAVLALHRSAPPRRPGALAEAAARATGASS
jgi:hypothetical protein